MPPKLSTEQALANMRAALPPGSADWLSFYSSVAGGIITDPTLMCVPVDDHMVHRGHAVFDTANVNARGQVYGLSFHLDRLVASAKAARIEHVPSKEHMRSVVLHTVAAAQARDGGVFVRYWLSAARGDFAVGPRNCPPGAHFYVVVHRLPAAAAAAKAAAQVRGVTEALVAAATVPHKPRLLASAKTNNYLLNALTAMAAEDAGGQLGIGVDVDGFVTEQATACVGFLGTDKILRCPPFGAILESTTLRRCMELLQPISGVFDGKVKFNAPVLATTALAAVEVVSFGGGGVLPIVRIETAPYQRALRRAAGDRSLADEEEWRQGGAGGTAASRAAGHGREQPETLVVVGDGKPGPLFAQLKAAVDTDLAQSPFLDEVPYEAYEGTSSQREGAS